MREPTRYRYGPGAASLGWLADQAALATLAEHDRPGPGMVLDLSGRPVLADRVAIGLERLQLPFTRSDTADDTDSFGTLITVHEDPSSVLADRPYRPSSLDESSANVRAETRAALRRGFDLDFQPTTVGMTGDDWVVARSAPPSELATELVDAPDDVIAWSNREAQRYVTDAVRFDDDTAGVGSVSITTSSRSTAPSVAELPYDSGMVIGTDPMMWGVVSAEVVPPIGGGLWPAVWLLDAEACRGPGRCAGHASPLYHEIDLLELRGQAPGEGHLSLHWWDERIRSQSTVHPIGEGFSIALERRPGLLIWRIDGAPVQVVTGRVEGFAAGPHRAAPMMLIVNTAVGGSFAGSREIGRDGDWLGEALVPDSYPAPLKATFTLTDIRVSRH